MMQTIQQTTLTIQQVTISLTPDILSKLCNTKSKTSRMRFKLCKNESSVLNCRVIVHCPNQLCCGTLLHFVSWRYRLAQPLPASPARTGWPSRWRAGCNGWLSRWWWLSSWRAGRNGWLSRWWWLSSWRRVPTAACPHASCLPSWQLVAAVGTRYLRGLRHGSAANSQLGSKRPTWPRRPRVASWGKRSLMSMAVQNALCMQC